MLSTVMCITAWASEKSHRRAFDAELRMTTDENFDDVPIWAHVHHRRQAKKKGQTNAIHSHRVETPASLSGLDGMQCIRALKRI